MITFILNPKYTLIMKYQKSKQQQEIKLLLSKL